VFVALGILRAIRTSHIVICGLPGSTIYFFFTLSHKRHDLRKRYKEYSREEKGARKGEVIKENVMLHKKRISVKAETVLVQVLVQEQRQC